MNPGQSVKDRAALFIIEDAVAQRRAAAGRRHRRGHRRQYRHRPGARRQRARLPHRDRDPGDPEPGEEGHAAALRRRAGRGAGRALRQSQQLREGLRPPRRAAARRPSRTARSGPTSSTTSPTAKATSRPPARKSGSRPTARSTASSARSAPAARLPASPWRSRRATRTSRSASPTRWAPRSTATTRRGVLKAEGSSITEGIGQGRITKNLEDAPIDVAYQIPRRGSGADHLRPARARRASASAARPASTSRARSASPRSSGPATPSSPCSADYGTRYQSKLFNPEFLRSKRPAGAGMAGAAQAELSPFRTSGPDGRVRRCRPIACFATTPICANATRPWSA